MTSLAGRFLLVSVSSIAPETVTLTLHSSGDGTITEPGEVTFTVPWAEVIRLVASTGAFAGFAGWSGDVDYVTDSGEAETTIALYFDSTITANFESVPAFLRGDCNGDRAIDIADALRILFRNFVGGMAPPCEAACDANGDDSTTGIDDAVYLLTCAFLEGLAPPVPFPLCGVDANASELSCDDPPTCP